MAREAHRHAGPESVACGVVTVSSTRTLDTDESGPAIEAVLEDAGHDVVERRLVGDDEDEIRATVEALAADADVLFLTGGTGPAPSDVTPEALRPRIERVLPGFGERFRRESEAQVAAAAMFSRAFACVLGGAHGPTPAFALPGSPSAAELGAELVAGELGHLVGTVRPSG